MKGVMKMISDTEMLDWLETQLKKSEYTGKCIFRWSNNGRGFRLHETSLDGAVDTVREAIENAILDKPSKENLDD